VRKAAQGRPEVVVVVNREVDLWPPGWLDGAPAPEIRLAGLEDLRYFAIYTYARQ
jgi:hypothetical protein